MISTNLVSRRVTKAGEEGEELGADARGGRLLEDDLVQLRHARNLALVAHQPLRDGVNLPQSSVLRAPKGSRGSSVGSGAYGVEHHQLGDTGGAFETISN